MTLVCRTVLDLRSPLDKFTCQTLLLAASWHRHCRQDADLEVLTVGGESRLISDFLDGIGAAHGVIAPGDNDDFSKSSNKIEAAYPDPSGRRLLLLDNDVAFFGSLRELEQLPADAIAASAPGALRVSDAQWDCIRDELGLPLLRRRFAAVNGLPPVATGAGGDLPGSEDPEHYLYLNSGVVLFPAGHDHRASWKLHQRRINDHFRDHALCNGAVTSSDQAGFATSVAAFGRFAWLPLRYNYRRGCFRVGMLPAGDIRLVHFTGDVDDSESLGMSDRIRAYWRKFVTPQIERLPASVPDAERQRRRDIAQAIEAASLEIIRDYDLEGLLAAWRAPRAGPATP